MLDLAPGDIVIEMRGATFGAAFGVVSKIHAGRATAIVAFDPGTKRNSFRLSDGGSRNLLRRQMGWRIVALDAGVRKSLLKVGFAFGPCSRAQLVRMELRARELRAHVLTATVVDAA